MIKTYRKTATIKAEQFDGTQEMFDRYKMIDSGQVVAGLHVSNTCLIKTPEAYLYIHHHDWIATGVDGEHWPIADDIFKRTYAELPVIPRMVAEAIELLRPNATLFDGMDAILSGVGTLPDWVKQNKDRFARAWLDGYTVEVGK